MALVSVYPAGSTLATYGEFAHRAVVVDLDAITSAFPGFPILGLQAWPTDTAWPGGAGATIIESAPGGHFQDIPGAGGTKIVAVIGVPLGKLLAATEAAAPKVPWLLIGAGALGLWLLLRRR